MNFCILAYVYQFIRKKWNFQFIKEETKVNKHIVDMLKFIYEFNN